MVVASYLATSLTEALVHGRLLVETKGELTGFLQSISKRSDTG